MSGKKRIYVDERQWIDLQKKAKRLAKVDKELPRLTSQMRDALEAEIAKTHEVMGRRHGEIEEIAARMSAENRQLEERTTRRLRAHAATMRDELERSVGQSQEKMMTLLDRHVLAWGERLNEEREARLRDRAELEQRLDERDERERNHQDRARRQIDDCYLLIERIDDTLPHQRFAPGRLHQLQSKVATAEREVSRDGGAEQAAFGVALLAFDELGHLRDQIQLESEAWAAARTVARTELIRLRATIDANAELAIPDDDGAETEEHVDVDYWSFGGLGEIRSALDVLLAETRADSDATADRLREIVADDTPRLLDELKVIAEEASVRYLTSERRAELARSMVDRLGGPNGYRLADHTYVGEDLRESLVARLEHRNGSELVLDIAPVAEDPARITIDLLQFDHEVTADEILVGRSRELRQALLDDGVRDVSEPEVQWEDPDQTRRDIEALRSVARRPSTG